MEEGNKGNRHVIVMPYPAQGHLNPLLQFAKRLAHKGLKVTLATTRYTIDSICAANVGVEPISDGFDLGGYAEAGNVELFLNSFKANGSRTLSGLVKKFQHTNHPVGCIVYDSFLPWALDVAKQHGIYGAAFFTNSVTVCSIYCHIHYDLLELPVKREDTPLLLRGQRALNFRDLPTFLTVQESDTAYLAMKKNQFSNLSEADCIFVNSFEELEREEAKGISDLWPAKLIGPMVPSAYLDGRIKGDTGYGSSLWKPLSDECKDWLDKRQTGSVAYVSFGSMVSLTPKQMEEMAWGLKESGFHFLWVVRESERAKLPDGFMESTKEKGLMVSWCNQLEILGHPAVGCFVTHCGWNSTLEGLSLGVTMVGMPQWSDQITDAKFVEEVWRVGVWGMEEEGTGVVKSGEVVRCLKEVMEGERSDEMKKNAAKWRELAKKAVSQGGSSDKFLDEFLHLLARTKQIKD